MSQTRYVVGVDLGTTHCSLAYVDTEQGEDAPIQLFDTPQVVEPGDVEAHALLPSFLYLAGEHELPEGSLDLPWARGRAFVAGEFARKRGAEVPARVIASSKSWLRHTGVDRTAPILPWDGPPELEKLSPLGVAVRYLEHLRDAWNQAMVSGDEGRLEDQEVMLTVPASFDAAARELTARAAEQAGLEHVTLLEEPQAALYAWLDREGERWRQHVAPGDRIVVCDVGGGTTDLTLIAVGEQDGELVLERVAVGDHILLGGDNMDLALAHAVAEKLGGKVGKGSGDLDPWQLRSLWHSCREAKEALLADPDRDEFPVVVVGRGSKLIGGTLRTELKRGEMETLLLDGFFPECARDDVPQSRRTVGIRELGLPYESDPAVTRHVAHFLARQAGSGKAASIGTAGQADGARDSAGDGERVYPTAVLFNGGVMKAPSLRERVIELLNRWLEAPGGETVKVLEGTDLDLAVARGAAYYGLARRGRGIRIRGGTARSYYIGIESTLPAVPGMPAPLKALCVVPFGMEEGDEADIPGAEFGLVVGEPVEFRFFGSITRKDDAFGAMLERVTDELEELPSLATTLAAAEARVEAEEGAVQHTAAGTAVPVRLRARVTEVGTLELWCVARDGSERWKLEFNVREQQDAGVPA